MFFKGKFLFLLGVYQSTLYIDKADDLDEGMFTCQVRYLDVLQCAEKLIEITGPPDVQLMPMSVTVQKVSILIID